MIDEELVQLLTPEGQRTDNPDYESTLSGDEIFGLYRDMVIIRRLCNESTSLQRQGQLALWAPVQGQEAAQIGAGRALAPKDFSFPSYREHGVAWCRGVPPEDVLRVFRAVTTGGWDPQKYRHSVPTVVLGNQTLHAVGYAMGIQRDGAEEAALTFFGDGASSQGDVLESFVWAASFNAPVVFFCQNNQWGISTPSSVQSKIPLYHRAHGFGFPGVRVDGNDVLAVYEVTKRALENARVGGGPMTTRRAIASTPRSRSGSTVTPSSASSRCWCASTRPREPPSTRSPPKPRPWRRSFASTCSRWAGPIRSPCSTTSTPRRTR
jgi:2-oxoisovalerate dehydrogenase E1 component alpha subunit